MPADGTFLSVDPVESEPPYQYVRGNPVGRTDPSGFLPLLGEPNSICMSMPDCIGLLLTYPGAKAITLVAGPTLGVIVSVPVSLFAINYYFCGWDGCYIQPTIQPQPAPQAQDYFDPPETRTKSAVDEMVETAEQAWDSWKEPESKHTPTPQIDIFPGPDPRPAPTSTCTPKPKKYLYHYTTENGYIGIMTTGFIMRGPGILGSGVYLTDISPGKAAQHEAGDLAEHLFSNYQLTERVQYWVRADVTELPIKSSYMIFNTSQYGKNKDGQPYGTPYMRRTYFIYHKGNLPVPEKIGGKTLFRNE